MRFNKYKSHAIILVLLTNFIVISLFMVILSNDVFPTYPRKIYTPIIQSSTSMIEQLIINDIVSKVYHDYSNDDYIKLIRYEYNSGTRDKYYIANNYTARLNNEHFNDIGWTDSYQKDVYAFTGDIMKYNSLTTVIDIGCGSGYKLVNYLANTYKTYGVETEPAISYLRKTYPNQTWFDSGKPDQTFTNNYQTQSDSGHNINNINNITLNYVIKNISNCLVMAADVIEHIVDPNILIDFIKSFKNCNLFVLSTPNRDVFPKQYHRGP
eukprot:719296_1